MSWLRRTWTPAAAQEWTREDYVAMVLSVISYLLLAVGPGLCFLLPVWGIPITIGGVLMAIWMYRVIDPKLRVVSVEYEQQQRRYLEKLERITRWESEDGSGS